MPKNPSEQTLVKIADAARILGVHKDTLRRWERVGKIKVIRHSNGARLYNISDLVKITPARTLATEELLKSSQPFFRTDPEPEPLSQLDQIISEHHTNTGKSLRLFGGFLAFLVIATTGLLIYLKAAPQFSDQTQHKQKNLTNAHVLGENAVKPTIKFNANEKVTGSLVVDADINGVKLGLLPSATEATINAQGSVNLDQDLSITSSPTFAGLTVNSPINAPGFTSSETMTLTSPSNQITFDISGIKSTITWGPTSAKTITLPNATDTLIGKTTTDTLSNKTIKSGDSNTISGSFPDITGITSLGTISTGTWNGTKIGIGYGGTNLTSYTKGDILYSSASDTLAKLGVGSSGQILTVSSGIPAWTTSISGSGITADSLDFTELSDSLTLDANLTISASSSNYSVNLDSGTLYVDTGNNRIGIGTTSPAYALDVNGAANISGALTVSGNIIGPSSGTSGYWQRSGTTLLPATSGDSVVTTGNIGIGTTSPITLLDVNRKLNVQSGGNVGIGITSPTSQLEIVASSTNPALTLRGASSGSNNILSVTNSGGTSTYFSVDSSGQLSGSAFQITDAANAVVGTAIAGGWTMNSNTFTYRRVITITNSSGSTMPTNYQISISLPSSDSSQVYSKSQQSSPYYDFRIAYGGTPTDIARNVSSFTSSSVAFTFQTQAAITNGSSDTYYIYYGNSSLSSTPSTYTGDIDTWETFEDYSTWTSGDSAFIASDNSSSPASQQGTNSMKMQAMVDRMGVGSTASQGQLPQGLKNHAALNITTGGTDYVYVLGGNTGSSDQTTVYKTTISSANVGVGSTASQGQLSTGLSGLTVTSVTGVDGGTGADGTLDLSLGSGAGGCNGTGLSWTAGTSTCTIATATKSTFNFTTINISSGTTLTTSGTTFPTLKATGNITIAGTLNLEGKGSSGGNSASGSGSGGGGAATFTNAGGGGGGYGGVGGTGGNNGGGGGTGGSTYGTAISQDLGSGGGGGVNSGGPSGGQGGNGGGGIQIASKGIITVSGTINVNGSNGSANDWGRGGGGGGSGGKVILQGDILTISGSISANGGNGGLSGDGTGGGGGGGGGRITLQNISSIDTTGSTIAATAGSGASGTQAGSNGSNGVSAQSTVTPNLYVLGGLNGSTAQSTVYKTTVDSSGNIGTLSSSGQSALPQALYDHTTHTLSVGGTDYVYILGGNNGTSDQTTVYRATIDSSSNIGTGSTTSQGQLPQALSKHASATLTISGTTYIYVLGGKNGSTTQTTVYKATIDGSGNIGSFSASGQGQLPVALQDLQATTTTVGSVYYMYVFGGNNGTSDVNTIYRATIDSSGNIGTFSATGHNQLQQALSGHTVTPITISSTPYYYIIGGTNGSNVQTTVYKSTLSSDMTNFTLTKTVTSVDLSNKNDLQFKWYSNSTASDLMQLAFSEDGSTWQTTTFTSSSASTWETKAWDISAIAAASRNAVTRLRIKINSAPTTEVTSYIDDLDALMEATTYTNSTSNGRAILGANNLAINAQGTGLVQINYATGSTAAGSGGFGVFDGTTGPLFLVNGSGNVGIGNTGPARLNIIGSGTGTALTFLTTSSAGTQNLAVLDNGNVGIGTTNPGAKLTVIGNIGIGTSASGAALQVNGGGLFGWGTASTSLSSGAVLGVNGNVGIGTTTANSTLSVSGSAHIGGLFQGISAPANGLFVDGNIGIGATTSNNKLDVWGNTRLAGTLTVDSTATLGNALIGYSGVTAPALGLAVSGNVGIGTTSPLGQLHVVGQCVTGNTRLRRRKRRKDGTLSDEYEDVEIKDIREGDQILSLNEKTGEFEPHSVKALKDMGKQEVFILVTQYGKMIETTGEHPYLTIEKNIKETRQKSSVFEVDQSPKIETLTADSIIALANKDQAFILKVNKDLKKTMSKIYQNKTKLFGPESFAYGVVELIRKADVAVSRLEIDTDYPGSANGIRIAAIIRRFYPNIDIHFKSVGRHSPAHLAAYLTQTGRKVQQTNKKETLANLKLKGFLASELLHQESTRIRSPHGLLNISKYTTKWEKVKYLKPGDIIATADGWEKISAKYSTGRKQTFDIEVAGTHNFVGNDIVAHNTAIFSGNVGIGVTSPLYKLDVAGAGNLTGNLGIGNSLTVTSLATFNAGLTTTGLVTSSFRLSTSPSSGYALVSDAGGNGAWTDISSLSGSGGNIGAWTLNGSSLYPDSLEYNIGIGTSSTSGARLSVMAGNVGIGTTTANSTLSVSGSAHIGGLFQGIAAPANGLFVDGNVGIGATTSSNKLDVWGNARIAGTGVFDSTLTTLNGLVGYSGVTAPASGLAISGNVGVGTTSALGQLHVVGQCVAEGTRIRRKRKGVRGKGKVTGKGPDPKDLHPSRFTLDPCEWEDIPVEDILPDDEVLSLNDKTGKWEWHKVEKTWNKGRQEIIKIITQQGKWIETTNEHPYLTIEKNIKSIPEAGKFEVDLSTRMEKNSDTFVAIANKKTTEVMRVTSKDKQALKKLFAKTPRLFAPTLYALCIIEIIRKGKIRPSQLKIDTDYLGYERRIAELIHRFYPELVISFAQVGHSSYADRAAYLAFSQKKKTGVGSNLKGFPTAEWLHHDWLHGSATHTVLTPKDYHRFVDLSRQDIAWKKVKYLKSGMVIATVNGWEKIQAKYTTGRKQTYDLQIEGTYNFVGNDIVAHNTFITGNVGIGAAFTTSGVVTPSNGLAVQGNMGIGTTSPTNPLTVIGNVNATGTFLAANGSASLPSYSFTNSISTGMYSLSTNALSLVTNGAATPAFTITAAGNVGIGTTAPGVLLDINGIVNLLTGSSNGIQFQGTTVKIAGDGSNNLVVSAPGAAAFTGDVRPVGDNSGALGTNSFRFNSLAIGTGIAQFAGNVGIGFTSPERLLQLTSDINIVGSNASLLGAAGTQFAITGSSGTGGTEKKLVLGIDTTDNYGVIQAGAVGTNYALSLNPAGGNVGIGTTSPTGLLQIQGTGSMPVLLVTAGGNIGIGTSVTSNPLTIGIDGSTGNGAYLSTGGVWTNGSSREFKENFTALNNGEILSRISQLDILQWNYKLEDPSIKHIGPIAEDFYSIFGVGNDPRHISTIDPAGVALAGIKALITKQASTSAILANLSISPDGTLNVPKLRAGAIVLDSSLSVVPADDIGTKLASMEDRIANLERKVATSSATLSDYSLSSTATSSATPSASLAEVGSQKSVDNLNLTPPDLLLATSSATLANINVTSEATVSGMLTAYQVEIQDHFKSLGQTTLGKTLIAGDLTVDGTLSVTGNSINAIGILYLQNSPLASGVDIFNGKVIIDKDGQATAAAIQTNKLILGPGVLGETKIAAGATEIGIETPAVSAKSKIFVTSQTEIDTPLFVSDKIIGTGFVVKIKSPSKTDIIFDWSIIDSP